MPTNPFFRSNYFGSKEQSLYQDLIIESIKMYGIDMLYIPREYVALDRLYGEDKISAFRKYYELEFYIKNIDGYQGERDILSKFNIQINDTIAFTVAQKRFKEEVGNFEPARKRPQEGDLIYFPLDKKLFEITFSENMEEFYQVGTLFTYEIRCKTFEYASQKIETGIPEIDELVNIYSETTQFTMTVGSGAFVPGETVYQGPSLAASTASAEVVSWQVSPPVLLVVKQRGDIIANVPLVGQDSSASWSFDSTDSDVANNVQDPVSDTENIKSEALEWVDTTESNPLSD